MASNAPHFETRTADIIGRYVKPPHAAVFYVDEMSTTLCDMQETRGPKLPVDRLKLSDITRAVHIRDKSLPQGNFGRLFIYDHVALSLEASNTSRHKQSPLRHAIHMT